MMELSLRRYQAYLFFQLAFLLVDLVINSYSYLARGNKMLLVLMFLTQDVCLILSLVTFFFGLYSTYVYQAGLVKLLYSRFRTPIVALILYLLLSVTYHVWICTDYPHNEFKYEWSTGLTALWFIQRSFSPVYYYLYKRSALRLSDPEFYDNLEWVNERLAFK